MTQGATQRLVLVADLAGTTLFALQGALAAIGAGLDLMGILVIAFVTAVGGGIIRDVLIGATPAAALRDWRYPACAILGAALAFPLAPLMQGVSPTPVMVLDAAALALFAVAGAEKALAFGLPGLSAIILGTTTGVGGGMIRDVLLNQVPVVLRVDVYATAALFGAMVVVAGRRGGFTPRMAAITGGVACFGLRVIAATQGWQLPGAGG